MSSRYQSTRMDKINVNKTKRDEVSSFLEESTFIRYNPTSLGKENFTPNTISCLSLKHRGKENHSMLIGLER